MNQTDSALPQSVVNDAKANWRSVHEAATIVDLQGHPALKATWLGYDLTELKKRTGFIQRLFSINPFGFDPFSLRVSFPKLVEGGVNVQISTIYALERQSLLDIELKPKFLSIPIPATVLLGLMRVPLLDRVVRFISPPDYYSATLETIAEMEKWAGRAPEVEFAHSVQELERAQRKGKTALIHALEGGHCLEGRETYKIQKKSRRPAGVVAQPAIKGQLERLSEGDYERENRQSQRRLQRELRKGDRSDEDQRTVEQEIMRNLEDLFCRGVAMIGLCHYYRNEITHACFSYPERALDMISPFRLKEMWLDQMGGLTELGVKVVHRMLELGIIIDMSHVSETARREIYELVDHHYPNESGAVAASHIGIQAMHPHPYNLADWEIRWIAEHGGVVGVMFSNYWLMGVEGVRFGLGHIARTIEHILDVGGTDVVAFGTDFDGFSDPPDDAADAAEWGVVTQYLYGARVSPTQRRYTPEEIHKFLGGNALRAIKDGWGRKSVDDPPCDRSPGNGDPNG